MNNLFDDIKFNEVRIVLKKFEGEQTEKPFEEIIIENGEIVEIRRYKEDATIK
jgi:hypothetical protein